MNRFFSRLALGVLTCASPSLLWADDNKAVVPPAQVPSLSELQNLGQIKATTLEQARAEVTALTDRHWLGLRCRSIPCGQISVGRRSSKYHFEKLSGRIPCEEGHLPASGADAPMLSATMVLVGLTA